MIFQAVIEKSFANFLVYTLLFGTFLSDPPLESRSRQKKAIISLSIIRFSDFFLPICSTKFIIVFVAWFVKWEQDLVLLLSVRGNGYCSPLQLVAIVNLQFPHCAHNKGFNRIVLARFGRFDFQTVKTAEAASYQGRAFFSRAVKNKGKSQFIGHEIEICFY